MKLTTPEAFAHSNKVWKNKCFNSWIDLSSPSKVRVFLSLHMTHIRQWGIILQSTLVLGLWNFCDQLAISSTRLRGMTQWTPKRKHTIFHNSWDIGQFRSKWSKVSLFLLHMQHQSTTTNFRLLKLSTVKIFLNAAVQIKNWP